MSTSSDTNRSRPQGSRNQSRGENGPNRRRSGNRNRSGSGGGGGGNRSNNQGSRRGGSQSRQGNRSRNNNRQRQGSGGGGGGQNRRSSQQSRKKQAAQEPQTLLQKIMGVITFKWLKSDNGSKPATKQAKPSAQKPSQPAKNEARKKPERTRQKTDPTSISSPRLHVGNLSYDATEEDLQELFNGVGSVQEAEVVAHSRTHRSKGFAFVTMNTVDEARRAVEILDDEMFMGRKLAIGEARSSGRRDSRDNRGEDNSQEADEESAEDAADAEREPETDGSSGPSA